MPAATDPAPHSVFQMNARTILIPLLCLGAVAFACGPESHSEASLLTAGIVKAPAAKKTVAPTNDARITGQLAVKADGNGVHFALDVTNSGKKNVELAFPDGQVYEFAVVNGAGREVYRWGAGRMFTQSVQNRTLDGGETMRFTERASAKLPSGEYVAVARLRSSNFPIQETVAFTLR